MVNAKKESESPPQDYLSSVQLDAEARDEADAGVQDTPQHVLHRDFAHK